jgi:2-desacetyl-2-hydroxyethyl bacteriochlorophyllide A dehydrogenase
MKALRYHGPRDCRYEDVPDPSPGPDDVLIRIRAAGICGTDLEVYDGTMFYFTSGMTRTPITPGHEWSGEVVETGKNVTRFQVGDRVTGECSVGCGRCDLCKRGWYNQCLNRTETGLLNRDGGFADFLTMPAQNVFKIGGLSFEHAATIEPAGIALYPTKLAGVTPSDYVAVVGSGPIGLFMVQTARAYGAKKVILVGSRAERLLAGRKLGADVTLDYQKDNVAEAVREATDGHGADVILEAVGHPSVWGIITSIFAPRARVMITGLFAGKTCAVLWDPLVVKNITIMTTVGAPNCWEECIGLFERRILTAEGIITHKLPLSEFVRGIEMARQRTDGAIKIILKP